MIGQPLELCSQEHHWPTLLRGIEMAEPYHSNRALGLFLPADLTDEQLAPGTEVWTVAG